MSVGCAWLRRSRLSRRPPQPRSRPAAPRGGGIAAAGLVGGAVLLFSAPALAAEPALAFSIPAQPLGGALLSFGRQAGVSVGIHDLDRCGPTSRAVVGSFTPAAALTRLLTDTRCGFESLDVRAFNVGPLVGPALAKPPAPSADAPTATATDESLLEVLVTTTRRPSLVNRTPASVSVASPDSLTDGRIESLVDLAPEFSGVTVTNLGPGRDKVFVRDLSDGAFTGRTQSTVGLYLDDVPITYNAPDPDLRLIDLERVELMRGPQGSLYGVGSMGGIVRVVTKKPDLDTMSVGAAAGASATQFGGPSYSLDTMLNAPLVPGRLAVRAVAYTETTGGYVDNPLLSLKNTNSTRRTGGRLAVTGVISPDWRLTVGMTRQSFKSADSQYTEGDIGQLQRDSPVREPYGNDFTQTYASLEGSGEWGQLRLSAASVDHGFKTRSDASNGLALNGLSLFGSPSKIGTFDQIERVRLEVTEAVLTSPQGARLQWLLGAFASQTQDSLSLDLSAIIPDGSRQPLYLEDRHDRLADAAAYGEVAYALTNRLSLTVGARAFRTWLHTNSLRNQSGLVLPFDGVLDSDGVSPKVVLGWQISPTKLFYLQAAQGYRTGGFNTTGRLTQQFNATATGNQPNRQYLPDKLWSYEAGLKTSFDDRRLELRAAVSYTNWSNVQSDQFLPSGLPYVANVGRAVNTGFEGEGAFKVDSALTLRLNFLVAGPQLTRSDPTYPARPDASLPAVPGLSAALIADWRREVLPGVSAVLYGRLAYVGSSILTFQDQASSSMGNYLTARLSAGVEVSNWRMTVFVDNPADAQGDTFAFGDPFTQGRVLQSTPLRPRTVGVTVARGL